MIALALLALVLATALGVLHWALHGSQIQQTKSLAALLAQQQMEELLAQDIPKQEKGSFASPFERFSWSSQVESLSPEPFLQLSVTVNGPRGAHYRLSTQRCTNRRSFAYCKDGWLQQAAEDARQPRALLELGKSSQFSISPDGTTLAFVKMEQGRPQIFVQVLNSNRKAELLLRHPNGAQEPRYSPDGSSLAFSSMENGRSQVLVWSFAKKSYRPWSGQADHQDSSPCWTPDSQGLVVCRDGSKLVLLNRGGEEVLVTCEQGWNAAPDVSPDGKSMVFMSNRDGTPEIYRFDFSSKRVSRLTTGSLYSGHCRFSRDGHRVLYTSRGLDGSSRAYSMNPDGTHPVALSPEDCRVESAEWIP